MEAGIGSGDVIVCGYQGSGVPWVRAIIEVVTGHSEISSPHNCPLLEHMPEGVSSSCQPRLLSSHLSPRGLARAGINLQSGCKVVFALRNPKDVSVACWKGRKDSMGDHLPHFLFGNDTTISWFDFTLEWEDVVKNYPGLCVHVLNYEDLMENLFKEIQRLCDFLSVPYNMMTLQNWVGKCDLDTLLVSREPPKKRRRTFYDEESQEEAPCNTDEVGIWKKMFTVNLNEAFDKAFHSKMRNSDLYNKYLHG